MEDFSNILQLCRTDQVLADRTNLLQKLTTYSAGDGDHNVHDQLFEYVLKDIVNGYRGLLDGDLPTIIAWCVEHDYIQQALTFCTEQLPGYFWEKGILHPTQAEAGEYRNFRNQMRSASACNRNALRNLKGKYRSDIPNSDTDPCSKYAYEWMTNYLPFSGSNNDAQYYTQIMSGSQTPSMSLMSYSPSERDINSKISDIKNQLMSNTSGSVLLREMPQQHQAELSLYRSREKMVSGMNPEAKIILKDRNMQETIRNIARMMCYYQNGSHRRIERTAISEIALPEVLLLYYLLKNQRNETNHADGSEAAWSYADLRAALLHISWIQQNAFRELTPEQVQAGYIIGTIDSLPNQKSYGWILPEGIYGSKGKQFFISDNCKTSFNRLRMGDRIIYRAEENPKPKNSGDYWAVDVEKPMFW